MMRFSTIRNIDAQGRIVIPSEIRKILHIGDGEALEIEAEDQEIRLRRCEATAPDYSLYQTFLSVLFDVVKHAAFICSKDYVYAAKGACIPYGTAIPEELANFVREEKEAVLDLKKPFYILPHIKEPVTALFPIAHPNQLPLALVLLCKHQKPLSEMELGSAKLVAATLSHQL